MVPEIYCRRAFTVQKLPQGATDEYYVIYLLELVNFEAKLKIYKDFLGFDRMSMLNFLNLLRFQNFGGGGTPPTISTW